MERIVGLTPTSVDVDEDDETITMKFIDGSVASWYHEQDCCESVWVEDVNGNWLDLIGNPIIIAEKRSEENHNAYISGTYTFYTFRGIGGSVDVRWCGESNGYYSEGVSMSFTEGENK